MSQSYRDWIDSLRRANDARRAQAEEDLRRCRQADDYLSALEINFGQETDNTQSAAPAEFLPPATPPKPATAEEDSGRTARAQIEEYFRTGVPLLFTSSDLTRYLAHNGIPKYEAALRAPVANILKRMFDSGILDRVNTRRGKSDFYHYWMTPDGARSVINAPRGGHARTGDRSDDIPMRPICSAMAGLVRGDHEKKFIPEILLSARLTRTDPVTLHLIPSYQSEFQRRQLQDPYVRNLIKDTIRQVFPDCAEIKIVDGERPPSER